MQQEMMSEIAVTSQTEMTDDAPERGAEEPSVSESTVSDTAEAPAAADATDVGAIADDTPNGVRVRFNHTERQLSEREAVTYAQKGMKWEAFQQDYDRLRFLAEGAGQTVSELIGSLMERDREAELQAVLEKCGDRDTAQQLVDLRRSQRQARFQTAQETQKQEARQQRSERLAEGYRELKNAVPTAPAFDALPDEVIRTAVEKEISLYDAYLRHSYEQQQKIAAAAAQQQRAAAASTGSLAGSAEPTGGESQAFLSAFERVFS